MSKDGKQDEKDEMKAKPTLRERITTVIDPRKDEVHIRRGLAAAFVEFVCTFLFVFYATAAVIAASYTNTGGQAGNVFVLNATTNILIAFAQGLSLGLALFVASTASGGHLNPAVTIAVLLVGRISLIRAVIYIVAQFAGAVLASAVLKGIISEQYEGNLGATTINPDITIPGAFFLEFIMTFTLVFVLFGTALDPASKVGSMAPMAVGLVVVIDDLIGVHWTGGSMNPFRTLAPQLVSGQWDHYWLYFAAPTAGAIFAAFIYEMFLMIKPYEPPKRSRMSNNKQDHPGSEDKEGDNKSNE